MKYLTVTALNKYLKFQIERDENLKKIYIKGEISNLKLHQKGNIYFTLKDNESCINCIILNKNYDFLRDGLSVKIEGSINVYLKFGSYSIIVEQIEEDGIGALYTKYLALKSKLQDEGLFTFEKKELKKYPKRIGVITSKTGAVIEDIMNTLDSRYPLAKVILYPTNVQGIYAKDEIIKRLNEAKLDNLDCLILARGGGSLEDLWSFNEEMVVRAIKGFNIPVISAIGHETDVTLSDFVSDKRASTPTQAAMFSSIDKLTIKNEINNLELRVKNNILNIINNYEKNLKKYDELINYLSPNNKLDNLIKDLNKINLDISKSINNYFYNIEYLYKALNQRIKRFNLLDLINKYEIDLLKYLNTINKQKEFIFYKKCEEFNNLIKRLNSSNPLNLLSRGFSIVTKDDELIKDKSSLKKDDIVKITFYESDCLAKII